MWNFNSNNILTHYVINYGLHIVYGIILLLLGWIVSKWIESKIRKHGRKSKNLDETLTNILAQVVRVLILGFAVIVVLQLFGIQTASLIALIGGIGIAIGLAWQGVLKDFAAGIMILVMRPFKVNEAISIGNTSGVVDDIGIVVTKMHTFDNLSMTVPNSQIWGNIITNFTTNDTRRVDMEFGFGYDDDMDEAIKIAREVLEEDDRVLSEPEPLVAISELGGSSVNMHVRPWTAKENYWSLKFDITKRMKERFDAEGLNIPYPQHDVHLLKE